MFLPGFQANPNKKIQLIHFGGLDLRPKAAAGSLSQCENLSSSAFPALTPCPSRRRAAELSGIVTPAAPEYAPEPLSAFTGAAAGSFYYQGKKIDGPPLLPGRKSIADFNGKLCIFPDKLCFDYLPHPDTGTVSQKLESMEKVLTLSGVSFYSSHNDLTGAYTAYLSKSKGGFDRFVPGESLVISGCKNSANNSRRLQGRKDYAGENAIVSAVVEKASANRLDLLLYNKRGNRACFENGTESGEITVKVSIPDMDHVCVHNNRLWGTGQNGEYLYASKLGDCLNFNAFRGLGDDSWYSMVGTPGNFTGICSYRSGVVAFKRDCIHHIYGDAPQNFPIPKQTMGGCIDGRSIAELGGALYYLSAAGFQSYRGGEPEPISPQLPCAYSACAAGTDGRRYYAAAYRDQEGCDLLVFDPIHNLWHREDSTPFLGFFRHGGRLYAATEDALFELNAGREIPNWSFTTCPITLDAMTHKAPAALWLRMDAEENVPVSVEISADGKPFTLCETTKGKGFGVSRIPIRFVPCDSFRLRVSGKGAAVIHQLELITYQGGKTYGR